jgi:hemoglobin/transferrin/lactoferrin receptor protein
MTPVALALAFAWGLAPRPTTAQTAPAPNAPAAPATAASAPTSAPTSATRLPALTNTATRTERRVDDVPATVTVVPAAEIDARGARDIKELFRHEVDVSVRAAPPRFGLAAGTSGRAGVEGINIRGLEGNQVLMLVDGIRVPGSYSFGALATGRGDYLALEATAGAEVLRGPASTSFGSDGLAGALSLRTLQPADVLGEKQGHGGFVRLGGSQLDDSALVTGAVAGRSGAWEGLLLLSHREGHESDTQGRNEAQNSTRTAPNPLRYEQQVLLAQLGWRVAPAQRLGATLEVLQRRVSTEVYSGRAVAPAAPATPAATAVIDLDARDRTERQRLSLEHRYDDLNGRWAQKALTRLYVQDGQTRQFAAEDRYTSADRTRDSRYRERVLGLSTQLESTPAGALNQRISYGLDFSRTRITALRDGTPNPSAPPPFGETFPVRPFPDTDHDLAGAYLQSEIEMPGSEGRLTLIPGLRYDHYRLAPEAAGYSGEVVSLAGDALTPRLGAVWRLAPAFAPYAQWSQGFRAPAPGQVNNGFTNVASGYRSVGNPHLQPEKARSLELGLRGAAALGGGQLSWQLAGYDNRYRDFISQEAVGGSGTAADPTVFQFINLAQARIRGLELRGEWQGGPLAVTLASALTRGTSTRAGLEEPLDSVDPARTALGLRWTSGAWQWRADVLHAQGKAASRIRSTTPAAFAPGRYTVLDLGLRWQTAPGWALTAQLNNATDATYWRWSDVRGLADNSTVKDAYTAPGRHLQVALRHDF